MPNPKHLAALVKQQKKSPIKKAMPPKHDEDDDEDEYGSGSTDMSKMHPPKKGKGKNGDDEGSKSEGSKSEHSKEESHDEASASGDDNGNGNGDDNGGDNGNGGEDENGNGGNGDDNGNGDDGNGNGEEDGNGNGNGNGEGGGFKQFVAMLKDNLDVLSQIVEEAGDLPMGNPGGEPQERELSPDKKSEINEEIGRMPSQLQKGFKRFVKSGGNPGGPISWEKAQEVASDAGADDPEKFGAWLYWAGRS